jgi:GDA1/CD39 (nucleoside phosphatase) family
MRRFTSPSSAGTSAPAIPTSAEAAAALAAANTAMSATLSRSSSSTSYDLLSTPLSSSKSSRPSGSSVPRGGMIKTAAVVVLSVFAIAFLRTSLVPVERVYGLMIDAGSTGSRMHTFTFTRGPDMKLTLETEDFAPIKPGLSSFKSNPASAAKSLEPLLDRARSIVPEHMRSETPVFLRATAGLRLVGEEASSAILSQVHTRLKSSGFRFDGPHWATILGGNDEGIYSWITVNYLMNRASDRTIGTLEMGGGSSQVAFVPTDNSHSATGNCSTDVQPTMFMGANMPLYTKSHLQFGLKMARAIALKQFKETGAVSSNPCVNAGSPVKFDIPFSDDKASVVIVGVGEYNRCRRLIDKVIALPAEQKCSCKACTYHGAAAPTPIAEFVAISFYLDRTVALGMSTPLNVADIRRKGEEVCALTVDELLAKYPAVPNGQAVDLCFDLAFITSHLEFGHGITETSGTKLHVVDKIAGVELGWALGAMFKELQRLNMGS